MEIPRSGREKATILTACGIGRGFLDWPETSVGRLAQWLARLVYTKALDSGPLRPDGDSCGLTVLSSFSAVQKPGPKNPKKGRIFFDRGDNRG